MLNPQLVEIRHDPLVPLLLMDSCFGARIGIGNFGTSMFILDMDKEDFILEFGYEINKHCLQKSHLLPYPPC
jgi:hypothetical protein